MTPEEKLLKDKAFQHILKFAPESQRELMTYELANYFDNLIKEETIKARLDEMPTVEHKPSHSSDLRGMIVHFTSKMLDSPNDYGIYPTTNFYNDLEEAILDWHNKQVKRRKKKAGVKL